MNTSLHRICVNVPFSKVRMWAIGKPGKINIDTNGHSYPARDVPEVIASLKRVLTSDAVITVY